MPDDPVSHAPSPPDSERSAVDPERIAHFKIAGRLGAGGMGVVFRAHDESLRRDVALKLLPNKSARDPERRHRFLREARVAASLVHPNVAVVHQVGEADGHVYIAMELVDGVTLRKPLESGALPIAVARDYALQIARGLAAAHAKGIVHRDLKPENVMVTEAGTLKLLDFGLAKGGWVSDSDSAIGSADTEAQITREGDVLGSSAYMSPEQALGMAVDARSDVFSFGIVLYEMLTGRRPFVGRTMGEVRAAIAREAPTPLPAGVDPALAEIVLRCLEKRADARFEDAEALVRALSNLPIVSDVTARGATTAPVSNLPRGRAAWRGGVALGVALVLASAAVALGVKRSAAPLVAPASSRAAAVDPARALSRSANPDAQRAFDDALRSFHDGTEQVAPLLERAVQLDPTFGGAYLRAWLYRNDRATLEENAKAQTQWRRIVALESSLSTRDRELFAIMDRHAHPTVDDAGVTASNVRRPGAEVAALDAYLARYPDDGIAWLWRAGWSDQNDEALDVLDRALAADPTFVPALAEKAVSFATLRRYDDARRALARCFEVSPRAVSCFAARAHLAAETGQCAQAEADTRAWLELEPDAIAAQEALATYLAAQHKPIESVREALDVANVGTGGILLGMISMVPQAALPMLEGDFTEVIRVARDQAARARAAPDEENHFVPAATWVLASTEIGDAAGAANVAADFLARRAAWNHLDPAREAFMMAAAARGGRIATSVADARIAGIFHALAANEGAPMAWLEAYAWPTESVREARVAIAVLDGISGPLPVTFGGAKGRTLFLGGRGDQARTVLQSILEPCSLLLENTQNWARSHLYLGELDEKSGDTASACAHYAQVLDVWDHARPRSVTADQARARSRALACAAR